MSTTKAAHTPGPWRLVWHGNERDNGNGYPLTIHDARDEHWIARGYVSTEANARLIAAAPQLVEALEGLLAGFSEYVVSGEYRLPDTSKARAALAQAKGEAP